MSDRYRRRRAASSACPAAASRSRRGDPSHTPLHAAEVISLLLAVVRVVRALLLRLWPELREALADLTHHRLSSLRDVRCRHARLTKVDRLRRGGCGRTAPGTLRQRGDSRPELPVLLRRHDTIPNAAR